MAGGSYTLTNPKISFVGNGRSDFIGLGTGIVATGGSRVVVDGANILNEGVARAAIIADGGRQSAGQELPSRYRERNATGRLRAHHRHLADEVGALDARAFGQRALPPTCWAPTPRPRM